MSRAWPSGRRARSPRDMARGVDCGGGRRRGALRRPGRAAPTAPLEVKEGGVSSVAFGPEGQIAAGYGVGATSAAWCSSTPGASGSDPRRWRSRRAMSRAWPSGRRARSPRDMASAASGGGGGVVLFDARGERLRPAPLEVKEGHVTSVAFGPEGKIAAGYGVGGVDGGGVVLFDARGERLRPTPLEVKEGSVESVAFGPEGKIAAGYGVLRRRRRRGALRRRSRLVAAEGGADSQPQLHAARVDAVLPRDLLPPHDPIPALAA